MNLDSLAAKIRRAVETHALPDGGYARRLGETVPNEYGCADAANLLYTVGAFAREPDVRERRIRALQALQDPETGLFRESTHHPIHTTAHCVAALELFDARPRYPLKALMPYLESETLFSLLDNLDWAGAPWPQSHQGAGVYAALVLAEDAPLSWQDAYFEHLRLLADPEYGLSRAGAIQTGREPVSHHLYGWFHYLFNHMYAHRPIPYAERLIDTCLGLWLDGLLDERFGRMVGFMEIDWLYALNRAAEQTGYRTREAKAATRAFALGFVRYLDGLDADTDECFNDLHMLFGAACALAEIQRALPGEYPSTVPLKLALDRRPFI